MIVLGYEFQTGPRRYFFFERCGAVNTKVTIRDVAAKAGVSISSVHFALSGKAGVSDGTREKIRRTAEEMGYQPNTLASSLKRSTQRIAILLPSDAGDNKYYYQPMWRGVHDYLSKLNANVECIELPYYESDKNEVFAKLKQLVMERRIDGILTVGHVDGFSAAQDWQDIHDRDISVVSINSENKLCDSLCCIQPEYDVIGRTMAELIIDRIPEFGSIFLCAGNPKWDAHSLIVKGFDDYLAENRCPNLVYKDYSYSINRQNYLNIFNKLTRPDVAACCSVYSQGTVMLGQALEESKKAGKVYAVGSDLPDVTAKRLRRSVLNNVIQKNPYAQGYVGIRTLAEYLISGKVPEQKKVFVGSEVVLKSNLVMYEHEQYRYMFL